MSVLNKTSCFLRGSLPSISRCLYSKKSEGNESKPKKTVKKEAKAAKAAPAPAPEVEETSDNTKYQCESYLNHGTLSFYEVEAQMTARRVGQPSSLTKPEA